MKKIKVINTEEGQFVELPEEFHFEGTEVFVRKIGDSLLLTSTEDPWAMMDVALDGFEEGFKITRDDESK